MKISSFFLRYSVLVLPLFLSVSCGEGLAVRGATATVADVSAALNQPAPQLEIPGAGTTSALRTLVTIDDENPAIGAPGAEFSWILDISEKFAQILTSFSERIFFQDDEGNASMLSNVISNLDVGTTRFGPHELSEGGRCPLCWNHV